MMASAFLSLLCLAAAGVVLVKTICMASRTDLHRFAGHRLQFLAVSGHWALVSAGAVAVVLGEPLGGPMLLIGLAALKLVDRRRA